MKNGKNQASNPNLKAVKVKPKRIKLPPAQVNYVEVFAERARAVLEAYLWMSHSDRKTSVRDLLHDVMHLCDCDPTFGNFDQQSRWAVNIHEATAKHSKGGEE